MGTTRLFAVLAGRDAQERIGRAPADETRRKRDDAEIGPGRLGSHEGQGKDGDARDDPDDALDGTDVLLH